MNRLMKRFYKRNEGSTLVEIIVSVLIIGIAFSPLLLGMNTALKVSNASEDEYYADAVAANCIETAKAFLIDGLKIQVKHGIVTSSDSVKDASGNAYTSIYKVSEFPELSSGAKILQYEEYDKLTGAKDKFMVSNIKEGTSKHTYHAEIIFDSAPYSGTGGQNDYNGYKSVSNITNGQTTELNLQLGYDENAFDEYISAAKSYSGRDLSIEDVKKYMKKKTCTIIIGKNSATAAEHPNEYYLKGVVEYVAYNNKETPKTFSNAGEEHIITYASSVQYYKSCPQTILYYYSVLGDIDKVNFDCSNNKGIGGNKINENSLVIQKEVDEPITIYAICKGDDKLADYDGTTKPYGSSHLKVAIDGSKADSDANKVKISSTLNLDNTNVAKPFTDYASGIITNATENDIKKMYDITVRVLDETNKVIAEKTSSIIN